jgi:hypothetical protein
MSKVIPLGEEVLEVKDGAVEVPVETTKVEATQETPIETSPVGPGREEVKETVEVDEDVVRLEDFQKSNEPKAPLAKAKVKERDLADFEEADKPLFRQMSNEAFERAATIYRERKRLAADLEATKKQVSESSKFPKSYAEHPEAYVLDPRYSENLQVVSQGQAELAHWREQYKKLRQGEDWEDLEVKDGKVVKVTRPPSAEAEADILGYINNTNQAMQQARMEIGNLRNSFKASHQSVVANLRETENNLFPQYKDWDKTVKENQYVATMVNALAERGLSSNILAPTVAKLYAALMQVIKTKPSVEKPKMPNSAAIVDGAGATVDDGDKVSMAEFDKYLKR